MPAAVAVPAACHATYVSSSTKPSAKTPTSATSYGDSVQRDIGQL